jgi:hypothetical protein
MVSLVATRKRKDIQNPITTSQDKGKVRILERHESHLSGSSTKPVQVRPNLPSSRTFSNLRRGSVKIFSIFRSGKSLFALGLHLHMLILRRLGTQCQSIHGRKLQLQCKHVRQHAACWHCPNRHAQRGSNFAVPQRARYPYDQVAGHATEGAVIDASASQRIRVRWRVRAGHGYQREASIGAT